MVEDGKEYEKNILATIDIPENRSTVRGVFRIGGWAIDKSELFDSEIDGIFIYLNDTPLNGGKFMSRGTCGVRREDVTKVYGDRFVNSGFDILVDASSLKDGLYTFYVYFHSRYFGVEYQKLELFVKN